VKEILDKSKMGHVLPLLKIVAEENNLKLNRVKDFKKIRILLENRYKVNRWKI
jgi:hypothetical protein